MSTHPELAELAALVPVLGLADASTLAPKSVLEACIFATVLIGFIGIIWKRNLMMKTLAMDVMSTGVIAFYVLVAARPGLFSPILTEGREVAYADPVPQAVILTAIVIGFSVQALMLVGVMKLSRDNPTLDTQEIERSHTP
ncbi:cation:proton antiporter subunit C [Leptolyngbya iicbica]|uniref:cation:proton antiporter subunit C n=1 Tax=Leptolyngbya iicbica TaxID=3161580 RepID=UPI00349EF800